MVLGPVTTDVSVSTAIESGCKSTTCVRNDASTRRLFSEKRFISVLMNRSNHHSVGNGGVLHHNNNAVADVEALIRTIAFPHGPVDDDVVDSRVLSRIAPFTVVPGHPYSNPSALAEEARSSLDSKNSTHHQSVLQHHITQRDCERPRRRVNTAGFENGTFTNNRIVICIHEFAGVDRGRV